MSKYGGCSFCYWAVQNWNKIFACEIRMRNSPPNHHFPCVEVDCCAESKSSPKIHWKTHSFSLVFTLRLLHCCFSWPSMEISHRLFRISCSCLFSEHYYKMCVGNCFKTPKDDIVHFELALKISNKQQQFHRLANFAERTFCLCANVSWKNLNVSSQRLNTYGLWLHNLHHMTMKY